MGIERSAVVAVFAVFVLSTTRATAAPVVELPLDFDKNLPLVSIQVNGTPVLFILDSAANGCVLDSRTAEAIGIRPADAARASGSGGTTDVFIARGVRLALGALAVVHEFVVLTDLGSLGFDKPVHGILGRPLFGSHVVELDYPNHRVRIFDERSFQPAADGEALRLWMTDGPTVKGRLTLTAGEELDADLQVDTGSSHVLTLCKPFVDRHHLLERIPGLVEGETHGIGGASKDKVGRIARITVGSASMEQPEVRFSTHADGTLARDVVAANLGNGFLKRHVVTFDLPHGRLYLRAPAASNVEFVRVAGGAFQMGDLWGDSPWAMPESPPRQVQVGDFLLGRHEVTVAEFARFVAATGYRTVAEVDGPEVARRLAQKHGLAAARAGHYSYWREHSFAQGPDHPVVLIAWEDAIAYCNWRSREEGLSPAYDDDSGQLRDADGRATTDVRRVRGYRLPTEAEWEFAARERGRKVRFGNGQDVARSSEMNFDAAGTGETVPSLRLPKDVHAYDEDGIHRKATTPVGSFAPNALGLFDMSGNAWEWCTDTGQGGATHVLRGGMHDTDAKACRASARIDWGARSFCSGSGFRIARTVDDRSRATRCPARSSTGPTARARSSS